MSKPRILVLADVPQWAWGAKAREYARYLSDRFEIKVAYHESIPDFRQFDLVHLFEVSQSALLTVYPLRGKRSFRVVAGLTAHVWQTWGAVQMRSWADQLDALHGNSRFLEAELRQFHEHVYYTPNGVDPEVFYRQYPQRPPVVFGHVGKPNPRKGGAVVIEAAQLAGVELRVIQRTSRIALSRMEMVGWYQGVSVMVCASNMDGTPNPMLEGAACECALLSTPIGNMPEFVESVGRVGLNGFLTRNVLPQADTPEERRRGVLPQGATDALQDELADRMAWFQEHLDATVSMGQVARADVLDGWTWERQVEHVARMWSEVLG